MLGYGGSPFGFTTCGCVRKQWYHIWWDEDPAMPTLFLLTTDQPSLFNPINSWCLNLHQITHQPWCLTVYVACYIHIYIYNMCTPDSNAMIRIWYAGYGHPSPRERKPWADHFTYGLLKFWETIMSMYTWPKIKASTNIDSSMMLTYIHTPVVPAQGGAELALGIYKTVLIYRACMRRAPAKPVLACILRKWCPVSHVTFEAPLRTSHFSLRSSHSTLHTSHSTLHTSHCTLRTPHFTSHCTFKTPHFTLHTSHFTVHTSHFSLLTAFFTLHTSHFTLHTHTSHCTLHAPHFTLHSSHSTLHLIWALLTLSQLISSHLISSHMSSKLSWITSQYYYWGTCMRRAPARCVLCAKLLQCCCPRTWPARDPGATQRQANTFLTLHIALFTPCTSHFTLALHLNSSHLSSYHLISCLPICQLSSWVYYKACTKHFPVLLCTTKLAQSTSQYYFVPQSLHKALPSTTLYYKACTKHFPVLLCTTKLAQTTSQYYCALQSLQKLLPSITLYYKACTNYFPVLLCTTKLAQSTSQYYFVLQSLHKALPSATLYYKACTKYVPVLLCDTKLAQRKLLHTASSFAEKLLHTASFLNREAFTHRSFYTQQAFTQRSFYTQQAFTHSKRLHTEHLHTVLLHMASVYTHTKQAFETEKLLHTKRLLHTTSFYTEKLFLHTASVHTQQAFTHRTLTHSAFTHGKCLHTHRETFTQRRFYTQRSFYTQQAFTHKIFYTLQAFTENSFYTEKLSCT